MRWLNRVKSIENYAEHNAEQWRGCVTCKESHHETSFCQKCQQCFISLIGTKRVIVDEYGTFVHCTCGSNVLWD